MIPREQVSLNAVPSGAPYALLDRMRVRLRELPVESDALLQHTRRRHFEQDTASSEGEGARRGAVAGFSINFPRMILISFSL